MVFLNYIAKTLEYLLLKINLNSSSRRANVYRKIQAVEDDSAWQLHRLFIRIPEAQIRAKVFLHILEEEDHAKIFKAGFQQESKEPFIPLSSKRQEIESEESETWRYFAHLYAGELDAAEFFMSLEKAMGDKYLNEGVQKVLNDEKNHVKETLTAPGFLNISNKEYADYIEIVKDSRTKEKLSLGLQSIINFLVSILLMIVYFLAVPFYSYAAKKRLKSKTHVYSNNFMKEHQ